MIQQSIYSNCFLPLDIHSIHPKGDLVCVSSGKKCKASCCCAKRVCLIMMVSKFPLAHVNKAHFIFFSNPFNLSTVSRRNDIFEYY